MLQINVDQKGLSEKIVLVDIANMTIFFLSCLHGWKRCTESGVFWTYSVRSQNRFFFENVELQISNFIFICTTKSRYKEWKLYRHFRMKRKGLLNLCSVSILTSFIRLFCIHFFFDWTYKIMGTFFCASLLLDEIEFDY